MIDLNENKLQLTIFCYFVYLLSSVFPAFLLAMRCIESLLEVLFLSLNEMVHRLVRGTLYGSLRTL